jgi:nicotinate-nucleotide pyrophosphorylase (carboxylating)
MITPRTDHLIDLALEEDVAHGDLTSRAIFPDRHRSRAFIEAGHDIVVSGTEVAARVFARVDPRIRVTAIAKEGTRLKRGGVALRLAGPTASILTAERTALNFLQRLSGIATLSRKFADAVKGTGVRVVDTRKTTPGFRALEKAAVRAGGCFNHRSSLSEHVMMKDNHIAAAGSIARAVELARRSAPHLSIIEVEAKTMAEVRAALAARAGAILLDNMSPEQVRRAVAVIAGRALVEVSGGIRLETIRDYAVAGVDVISIGALTHSAPAADFSLTVK